MRNNRTIYSIIWTLNTLPNFKYYLIVFWNSSSLSDSKKSNFSFYVDQGMCNECVEDRGGLQCSASIKINTTNLYIGDLIMLLLFMYFLRRG